MNGTMKMTFYETIKRGFLIIIVDKTSKRSPKERAQDWKGIHPPEKSILETIQGVNNPYRTKGFTVAR